jgi:hypothetical protein
MTSPHWTVMNDLSNTITSYLTVRDLIRDNIEDPKVLEMAVDLLEYFINKQDEAFEKAWDKVVKSPVEDIQPLDLAYTENDKEQIYKNYRASIDEYNTLKQEHDSLQLDYEHLQDLFYRVDSELDELKVKYDEVQKNYHIVVSELKQSLNRD